MQLISINKRRHLPLTSRRTQRLPLSHNTNKFNPSSLPSSYSNMKSSSHTLSPSYPHCLNTHTHYLPPITCTHGHTHYLPPITCTHGHTRTNSLTWQFQCPYTQLRTDSEKCGSQCSPVLADPYRGMREDSTRTYRRKKVNKYDEKV